MKEKIFFSFFYRRVTISEREVYALILNQNVLPFRIPFSPLNSGGLWAKIIIKNMQRLLKKPATPKSF
jgi:hypothetical protein